MNDESFRMKKWLHVLVGLSAAACTAPATDETPGGADRVAIVEPSGPVAPETDSPAAADAGVAADAAAAPDASRPRVYCWLVPDPRCGTGEVIDAC